MSTDNLQDLVMQKLYDSLTIYKPEQIDNVLALLEEGATVPFVARYRKELTGALDETQIRQIREEETRITNLEKRRQDITRSIEDQGKMTKKLAKEIQIADKLTKLEDLYLPYKQQRRTKATIAKERGLEPLANQVLANDYQGDLVSFLASQVKDEEGWESVEAISEDIHEILAEQVSHRSDYRDWTRQEAYNHGLITSKLKNKKAEAKDERKTYQIYYDFQNPVKKIKPHQILAMNRGEKEGILTVKIANNDKVLLDKMTKDFTPQAHGDADFIEKIVTDAYKRFIEPAIEREVRSDLTKTADDSAIQLFAENLKNLLIQSPMRGQVVMGFDPAYRTGCKLAIVNENGTVLAKDIIYPHEGASRAKRDAAGEEFLTLIEDYQVDIVAIGNGTASRESEVFVAEQLKELDRDVYYAIISEAGASVYSASELAREEFPDFAVEERSAVSIARRLQDPLAELIKIDPKSIGVGQYQHDVSQKELSESLEFVVDTVVNQVGVNVNTASIPLLQHVSGLNKTTATNIVKMREEEGNFETREDLKKVPRLGAKAFEQSAGFLRIPEGKNILDNTPIHPESYDVADTFLAVAGIAKSTLESKEGRDAIVRTYLSEVRQKTDIGMETLRDIKIALMAPGRDLRDDMPQPILRRDVLSMEDLQVGMEMEGTVRNVVDFGAFVDIGVKQDGLVHITQMSHDFIKHPTEFVSVGDIVEVEVVEVDLEKGRIGLSMLKSNKKK